MVIFCSLSAWLSEPCLGDGLQITNGLEEESVELSWGVAQVQVHIISFLLLCIRELKQLLKAYFLHRKCTDVRPISEVSSLNYSGIQIVYFHHGTRKIRTGIIRVPVVKFRLQWCYILYAYLCYHQFLLLQNGSLQSECYGSICWLDWWCFVLIQPAGG